MKPNNLDRALDRLGKSSTEGMESAHERVRETLRSEPVVELPVDANPVRVSRFRRPAFLAAAAAIVVAVVLLLRSGSPAVLETVDGSKHIDYGASIQLKGAEGGVLALEDGSRVEMRAGAELSLERAEDGLRILLANGGIIVRAAKQHSGHFYVQTKDIMVSVVGTVFLVNAEEQGSRVAVIEGEVRVRQGATEQKLLPGQQVSTSALMKPQPVKEEIAWSREVETHTALLTAAQKRLEFEAISIRPNVKEPGGGYYFRDDNPNGPQWGFGCHGSDGIPRAPFGTGPAIALPLGRCVGNGVSVGHIMNYAYGTPWRFGPDIQEWATGGQQYGADMFRIEASAESPVTTTTAQLREMLKAMLADRFKIRTHTELQQVPGYALHIAKNGLKINPASGEIEQPKDLLIGVRPGIRGKSSLKELTRFLSEVANGGISMDVPFVDATGLTEIYEYEFLRSLSGGGGGVRGTGLPAGGPPAPLSRSERIERSVNGLSDSMKDRLGLELKAEKIPVEIIVIDQIDQPSPN